MKIQEKLKMYRKLNKMTLEDVAKILGISKTTVQRYESGQIQNISVETLIQLAEIYNVSAIELLNIKKNNFDNMNLVDYLNSIGYQCSILRTDSKTSHIQQIKIKNLNSEREIILNQSDFNLLSNEVTDYINYQFSKLQK